MTDPRSADDLADEPAFAGFEPATPSPAPTASSGYRVFARKYRPQTFDDLIGQDAMVQTVSNAFAANRIPQAWMLTGVRGVGKTTTARILARALNYDRGEAGAGPSIAMPELGIHCRSIMESRHVDVMELDAASHTGVDNMRQITDAIRYAPVQARYKVYIIDEVHMLSSSAFNAFLKTLEEPPPHAKFVLATTEIRKVPVTILSRCQRFDLRRVDAATLSAHLAQICKAEDVAVEDGALAILVRAAEGSVRDALSLLDQAVAHGAGSVTQAGLREMLGLADRGQVIDLFEAAMRGDVPACFASLRAGYEAGADPRQVMEDLADFTHLVTRMKLAPEAGRDPTLPEAERVRGVAFAEALSVRALSRAWQILLKAVAEVAASQRPLAAAEMALVRLAYAADLPNPDDVIRRLRGETPQTPGSALPPPAPGPSGARDPSGHRSLPVGIRGGLSLAHAGPRVQVDDAPAIGVAVAVAEPAIVLRRFEDVIALAAERRDIRTKTALERDVRLVRFEDGQIDLALEPGASRTLPGELSRLLALWTGRRWVVAVSAEAPGVTTVEEDRQHRETERRRGAAGHPLVQAVLRSFPGAEIVDVRERAPDTDDAQPEAAVAADPDATDDEI